MTPQPYGFEDEFAFFDAATADDDVYRSYREWITTIAEEEVEKLSAAGALLDRSLLLAAAMEPFDRAFKLYQRRDAAAPQSYPFSQYFRWWARQYATARLHRA